MDMLFDSIARLYGEHNCSIKQISQRLNISEAKTKKVLITLGLYETATTRAIADLRGQGFDDVQIADKLGISTKTVNVNSPYTKGSYNAAYPTTNALRIRKSRAKKEV